MAELDDSSDFIEVASDEASFDVETEFAIASDYDPTLQESLLGSMTSSVYAHCYEHGRRYHMYKYGRYPIPNDDIECGREGLKHALFKELLDGRLHLAPLANPQKIVDIGTGFGDWAMEMAELYPSAAVLGLDLSPIQPTWVPSNLRFVVDDVEEDEWIHGSDCDYMHLRMTAIALTNPLKVIATIFRNLKPGGWIEIQETYPQVGCNDATMHDDYVMVKFYRICGEVLKQKHGWDILIAGRLPAELEKLGFVNIQRKICHIPIGFWAKDRHRMHTAFLFREVLAELLPALQAKPIAEGDMGLTAEQIEAVFRDVRAALCSKDVHAYVPFHFIWAQKPLG